MTKLDMLRGLIAADDEPRPAADRLSCYAAETDRLRALADFLSRFAPAIGERSPADVIGPDVDGEASDEVHAARDAAIVSCFAAVEEIAGTTVPVGRIEAEEASD